MPGKPDNILPIATLSGMQGLSFSCGPRETATLIEPLARTEVPSS
jgi:hypothetical protein